MALAMSQQVVAQTLLSYGFDHPQDSARTKVWWFHGETVGTHEGITADLEAFKEQGVGGVVYYDQVHGKGEGAFKVFSPEWWDELIFSSQEAKRLGLDFEANASNGYVAGGHRLVHPLCHRLLLDRLFAPLIAAGRHTERLLETDSEITGIVEADAIGHLRHGDGTALPEQFCRLG